MNISRSELRTILIPAVITVVIILLLGIALLYRNQSNTNEELLTQIVKNQEIVKEVLAGQTARDEKSIDTIVCILIVPPPERTDSTISKCVDSPPVPRGGQ